MTNVVLPLFAIVVRIKQTGCEFYSTLNAMITFTPLSGAAHSSRTVPLAYILQVDDVRILLDCGSPDWTPENSSFDPKSEDTETPCHWEEYCKALKEYVIVKFIPFAGS
jgi:hypothetical protein